MVSFTPPARNVYTILLQETRRETKPKQTRESLITRDRAGRAPLSYVTISFFTPPHYSVSSSPPGGQRCACCQTSFVRFDPNRFFVFSFVRLYVVPFVFTLLFSIHLTLSSVRSSVGSTSPSRGPWNLKNKTKSDDCFLTGVVAQYCNDFLLTAPAGSSLNQVQFGRWVQDKLFF